MRAIGNGFLARLGELFASWLGFFKERLGLAGPDGRELLEGEMSWEELDAEIASYERDYGMSSAEFYEKFVRGEMPDTFDTNAWAIDYSAWLEVKKARHQQGLDK